MPGPAGWERYKERLWADAELGFRVDVSRMPDPDALAGPMAAAFQAMKGLEAGAIANPDENRQVGHYWLRDPDRAPDPALTRAIRDTRERIAAFAAGVHDGRTKPPAAARFTDFLLIGIGGSALGPQFLADALSTAGDRLRPHFIDNTDPDGIDRTLGELDELLAQTLTVVISKSGGTRETRNGMLETAEAYRRAGLDFSRHAVAITQEGSTLDRLATDGAWLRTFPIWDWVGGRTSALSAVGLLPAALQGVDIDGLLTGARDCDEATRRPDLRLNPAALLAAMWHCAGHGRGEKNMVVIPYKDRLALFGRYLQQLVMESLGKQLDRDGRVVHQGLTVYGNKGSTDQHSFVQQLREGPNDFFVTFVNVLRDRFGKSTTAEEGATSGDYLDAFWQGTRDALFENGRESLSVTFDRLDARSVGALIALYERAVGLYAELINVNAYHQPGVEAGKKAAGAVLDLQRRAIRHLHAHPRERLNAEEIARAIGEPDAVETVYRILAHASANPDHGIVHISGPTPPETRFGASPRGGQLDP